MCGWPSNGSLLEAGGASFVNFVKIEDFGGLSVATSHAYWIWDFEKPLNLVGEVDDGQPMAHFWHQEYDFWSSPLKACLPPEGRILCRVCCVLKKNQNAPPRPSELLCYMRSDFLFFNKRGGIRWFLFGHLGPYETISDWPFSLLLFSAFFGAFSNHTSTHWRSATNYHYSTLTGRQLVLQTCAATCGATSTTPLIDYAILQNNLPLHARKPQTTVVAEAQR